MQEVYTLLCWHMSEIKKVLIVRFGSLGDVLLTTPLLRALKTGWPDMAVDYFTKPAAAQLLHGNPYINRIHELEGAGFMALADQAGRMGGENYDLIVDLHRNLRSLYVNHAVASKKYVRMQRDRFRRDRKSTRLNSSHIPLSRMPSSA